MTEVSVEPSSRKSGQVIWESWQDQGLQYVTVLTACPEGAVTIDDTRAFSDKNELTYPVLADQAGLMVRHQITQSPWLIVIDPEMIVVQSGPFNLSDAALANLIEDHGPEL